MSKNNFCLFIFEDSGFFCDRNGGLFGITGNHDYLDSGTVQDFNCFDRIFSYVVSQRKDCKKDLLGTNDLHYGEKFHSSLRLCDHLLFHFGFLCRCNSAMLPSSVI